MTTIWDITITDPKTHTSKRFAGFSWWDEDSPSAVEYKDYVRSFPEGKILHLKAASGQEEFVRILPINKSCLFTEVTDNIEVLESL